jgi:hypothetical protein
VSEIVLEAGGGQTVADSGFGGKTAEGCVAISYAPSASVAFGGVPLARSSTAKSYPKPRPDAGLRPDRFLGDGLPPREAEPDVVAGIAAVAGPGGTCCPLAED